MVDLAVLGLRLDSMMLKVFPNLNDSVILFDAFFASAIRCPRPLLFRIV